MSMNISITADGRMEKPLKVEVFGLSVTLSGLKPDCQVFISESDDGLTVSIGSADEQEATVVSPVDALGAGHEAAGPAEPEQVKAAPEPDGEQELFKKLSELRKKISVETNVPPYVVFHDSALKEMCRALPEDLTALSFIQGVGKAKLEKYGELFIAAIRGHTTGIIEAA